MPRILLPVRFSTEELTERAQRFYNHARECGLSREDRQRMKRIIASCTMRAFECPHPACYRRHKAPDCCYEILNASSRVFGGAQSDADARAFCALCGALDLDAVEHCRQHLFLPCTATCLLCGFIDNEESSDSSSSDSSSDEDDSSSSDDSSSDEDECDSSSSSDSSSDEDECESRCRGRRRPRRQHVTCKARKARHDDDEL